MGVDIGTGTPTRNIGPGTYVATPVSSAAWPISGSNLVIELEIVTSGTVTVSAVAWDLGGSASEVIAVQAPAANHRVAIWRIAAPVAGTGVLTVTLSGACDYHVTATYFTGADQVEPSPVGDAYSLGSTGQAASQAHNVLNLTANDASYGGGAVSDSNNGISSVTPNQTYATNTATIDAEAGYAFGTTQVTTIFADSNDPMARVGVRIVAAAAPAGVPFVTQLGSQMVTRARTYPTDFYSGTLGTPLVLSQAIPPIPFALRDWAGTVPPGPKAPVITNLTHVQARPLYYPEVQPFNQSAWPIPPQPNWTLLVTIATLPLDPNPQAINLPFRQLEWALPIRPTLPTALRTWTQTPPKYYVETQPLAQFDWPLPRRAALPHDRLSWTQPRIEVPALPQLPGPPFTQLDWPLPIRAKSIPTERLGYIGYYALDDAAPLRAVSSLDLPPATRPWPIGLRTWVQGRSIFLQDTLPFHQTDWPNPTRRPVAVTGLSTWQQGRSLLLQTDLLPFHQTDWPLPLKKDLVITQRTWTQGVLGSPLSIPTVGWGPLLGSRRNRLIQRVA